MQRQVASFVETINQSRVSRTFYEPSKDLRAEKLEIFVFLNERGRGAMQNIVLNNP